MADKKIDLIWGIDNIAAATGRTRMQVYALLTKGILPAKKLNKRWVISRETLENFFKDMAA